MTALPPNADELVSAYLDGEATPDELALVEGSDVLMARVAELAAVSARLAAPLTPPPATRELHLAAALAAFDEVVASPAVAAGNVAPSPNPTPASTATVHAIELARERRARRSSPRTWVAAAAAAAALVVGVTAVNANRSDDGTEQVAESAEVAPAEEPAEEEVVAAADEAEAGAAFSADADGGAADSAAGVRSSMAEEDVMEEAAEDEEAMAEQAPAEESMATTAEAPAVAAPLLAPPLEYFLGDFESLESLGQALAAAPAAEVLERNAQITAQGLFPDCQARRAELATDLASVVAEATIASMPVEVHLVPGVEPPTVIIVDKITCQLLTTVPLRP